MDAWWNLSSPWLVFRTIRLLFARERVLVAQHQRSVETGRLQCTHKPGAQRRAMVQISEQCGH